MNILGIETSCDETAAAVSYGRRILSNVISSQVDIHAKWGGVVPHLAKRAHLEKIEPVIKEALKRVLKTCSRYDVAPGIHAFNPEMAKKVIADGFRFVALMTDLGVMKLGFKKVLRELGRGEEKAPTGY